MNSLKLQFMRVTSIFYSRYVWVTFNKEQNNVVSRLHNHNSRGWISVSFEIVAEKKTKKFFHLVKIQQKQFR